MPGSLKEHLELRGFGPGDHRQAGMAEDRLCSAKVGVFRLSLIPPLPGEPILSYLRENLSLSAA